MGEIGSIRQVQFSISPSFDGMPPILLNNDWATDDSNLHHSKQAKLRRSVATCHIHILQKTNSSFANLLLKNLGVLKTVNRAASTELPGDG